MGFFRLLLIIFMSVSAASTIQHMLANKRVLVTGAGRGIGAAIAVLCSRDGARVAIASRTRAELEETAQKMQNEALICVADVMKDDDVDEMIKSIHTEWGGLDILINNAGTSGPKGPFETLESSDLEKVLNMNVVCVHRVTKAAVPIMAAGGQIVNVSSRAGKQGLPHVSFYVASKFALEGMTASWAAELKDRNIRVNSISPGMVDTKSFPKPAGRPGVRTPEAIADGLFAILGSDVTGHYLHVDELDLARARGLDDSVAMKPINEATFDP